MSLFNSDRERRLWLLTAAVLLAIYSTMGPAQRLAHALRERNLLQISLGIVLVSVGTLIAWRWFRQRPGWREIGVGFGVAAAYVMALLRVHKPEERTHLVEYGMVAVLVHTALLERSQDKSRVLAPAVLAIVITALLGWLDESIQALLPNRIYDLRDAGFNVVAGVMAIVARVALGQARKRDR